MERADHLLEFVVPGAPRSGRKTNSAGVKAWKTTVRVHAMRTIEPGWNPLSGDVALHVAYYHRTTKPLDVDNMLKPILDALKDGVVMIDDNVVSDVHGHRRHLDERFVLDAAGGLLVEHLTRGEEFVHVVIGHAPDPRIPVP